MQHGNMNVKFIKRAAVTSYDFVFREITTLDPDNH